MLLFVYSVVMITVMVLANSLFDTVSLATGEARQVISKYALADFKDAQTRAFLERPAFVPMRGNLSSSALNLDYPYNLVNPYSSYYQFVGEAEYNSPLNNTTSRLSRFFGNFNLRTYASYWYGNDGGATLVLGAFPFSTLIGLSANTGFWSGTAGAINQSSGWASIKYYFTSRILSNASRLDTLSIFDGSFLTNTSTNYYNNGSDAIGLNGTGEFRFNNPILSSSVNTVDYYPALIAKVKEQHYRTLARFADYYSAYGQLPFITASPQSDTSINPYAMLIYVPTSGVINNLAVPAASNPQSGSFAPTASASVVHDARACTGVFNLVSVTSTTNTNAGASSNNTKNFPIGCEDIWSPLGTANRYYITPTKVRIETRAGSATGPLNGTIVTTTTNEDSVIRNTDGRELRIITELDLS